MKATRKYFFTVIGLMLLQIGMGVITAHYAVEGQSFFGLPLAQILPYTVSRTIHTQIGIFWIATAWLATGLYVAPLLSGREPKFQKLGVDALFWALIVVVLGSTITGWLGTLQHRGVDFSFWVGNRARVHEHGPRLADSAVHRAAVLGLPARPRPVACAEEAVGSARPHRDGVPVGVLHRRLLRDLAHLGSAHTTR
jgi:nitric oxide reductase large subunit